mmetsp:Transcript_10670/g.30129  ORF Transcript_10670/g.30129 Transcript_10670/m.30129 type:complete len:248 (-) Transcript_10670:337-1080(-)
MDLLLLLRPEQRCLVPLAELLKRHHLGSLFLVLAAHDDGVAVLLGLRNFANLDLAVAHVHGGHLLERPGDLLLGRVVAEALHDAGELVTLDCAILVVVEAVKDLAHLDLNADLAGQVPLLESVKGNLAIIGEPVQRPYGGFQAVTVCLHPELMQESPELRIVNVAAVILVKPLEGVFEVARELADRGHAGSLRNGLVLDHQRHNALPEGRGLREVGGDLHGLALRTVAASVEDGGFLGRVLLRHSWP